MVFSRCPVVPVSGPLEEERLCTRFVRVRVVLCAWRLSPSSRAWREARHLRYHIGVDGGVDFQTAADCAQAGADAFISGTALLHRRNLAAAVKKIRSLATAAARKHREEMLTA